MENKPIIEMAKRGTWITGQRSHSKKTKKRLEAKKVMLAAKAAKRRSK
ncbi:MAG TPA: hypothetical protein VIJ29_02230 [Candidatus Paceibacterota bacterium]